MSRAAKGTPPRSSVLQRLRRRGRSALVASLHTALTAIHKSEQSPVKNTTDREQNFPQQSPSARALRENRKERRVLKRVISTPPVIEEAPLAVTRQDLRRHQLERRSRNTKRSLSLEQEEPDSKKRVAIVLSTHSSFESHSTHGTAASNVPTNLHAFIDLTEEEDEESSLNASSKSSKSHFRTANNAPVKHAGKVVVALKKRSSSNTAKQAVPSHQRRTNRNSSGSSNTFVQFGEAANKGHPPQHSRSGTAATVVSRTPNLLLLTNNSGCVVVTEESSCSDQSISAARPRTQLKGGKMQQGKSGKMQQGNTGKMLAHKKRTAAKHTSVKSAKGNHRSSLQRELLALGHSLASGKAVPEQSDATKRVRVATSFFVPRAEEPKEAEVAAAAALSPPRKKRNRVASTFYNPAADAQGKYVMQSNDGESKSAVCFAAAVLAADRTLSPSIAANRNKNRRSRRLIFDDANVTAVDNRRSLRSTTEEVDTENTSPSLEDDDSTIGADMKKRPCRAAAAAAVQGIANAAVIVETSTLAKLLHCSESSRESELNERKMEEPSHSILLTRYEELAAQGRCEHVNFGRSLVSAKLAIDRKIKTFEKKCADDIEDLEVVADLQEYKRSLRSFSVYEDREKLALVHEKQEDMEAMLRRAGKRSKHNTCNHEQLETAKLIKRPMVFSHRVRMISRNNTCSQGPHCRLCGDNAEKQAIGPTYHALIPHIRQIDIDIDSDVDADSCTESSKPKRRRTRLPKHVVAPVDTAKATLMALAELKHSIAFIEEYTSSASFPML